MCKSRAIPTKFVLKCIMENKIEMFQVHQKIMSTLKLIPKDGKNFTVSDKLRIGVFILSFNINVFTCGYHLIKNKQRNKISLGEIVDDVADLIANIGMSLLVITGIKSSEIASKFLHSLRDFSKFGKPPCVEQLNRKLNIFSASYTSYAFLGACIYYILKISFNRSCEENNIKFNKSDICRTMGSTLLPFKLESPYDNIFRAIQVYSIAFPAAISCAFVAYSIGCSEFIVIRISHLKNFLEKVFADKDCAKSKEKLYFCIEYHNYIIFLVEQFNAIFEIHFILIFIQNGPLSAILGFRFILEPNVALVIHIFAWVSGLFMTCFVGQKLINESESIADAAYNSEWYEADVSSQIMIKMIILRAQRPLRQKVWKHTESSHATFGQIMKTSYSVLAVLNTLYN